MGKCENANKNGQPLLLARAQYNEACVRSAVLCLALDRVRAVGSLNTHTQRQSCNATRAPFMHNSRWRGGVTHDNEAAWAFAFAF